MLGYLSYDILFMANKRIPFILLLRNHGYRYHNQDDFAWAEESFSNEKMIDVQSCMFSIILLQLPYFGMICIWLEELNKVEHYYISYSDYMQYDYANMLMDYSCAHRSI